MSDDNDATALVAQGWHFLYSDHGRAAALGRRACERARRAGDAETEAHALVFMAREQLRDLPIEQAAVWVEQAAARCAELDLERAHWLADDLMGFIALLRRQLDVALALGERNDRIPDDERPPLERFITLHLLRLAAHEAGRDDEALGYASRMLATAELVNLDGHRAIANSNMGALHSEACNPEEALAYDERALALWRSLGARRSIGLCTSNVIHTCYGLGLHGRAQEVLQAWLAQPGGVDARDLHDYGSAVALAHLGVGQLDAAEQALASGPPLCRPYVHARAEWTWASGRLLCARGQFAEALRLSQSYLDEAPRRRFVDYPYHLYQLHDVVRVACEGLGDSAKAAKAARLAHGVCVPMFGRKARVRYLALQLERRGYARPGPPRAADQHRLAAIERGVRDCSAALERVDEHSRVAHQRRFLAHVSHEMRAPIGGMLGLTSLLLMSDLDDRQRKFVSLTRSSAETLLQLVNDILDLAKIESGKFALDPKPFAMADMATEVVEMFTPAAQAKGIGLGLLVDPLVPPLLLGDALRLRQVLTNLVSNGVKFTSVGEVHVCVKVRSGAAPDCCALRLEVRDTGKGISAEARQRLFTEFMQEDAATARQFGGTGLGLALTRQLVHLMNGEIGVDSEPGKGSLFWVELELPLRTAECHDATGAGSVGA